MAEKVEYEKLTRYEKVRYTMHKKYGADYYKKIGSEGGKNGTTNRPFATNRTLASEAGKKSGQVRRNKSQKKS